MGLFGLCKCLTRRAIEFSIIAALILFLPRIPPEANFSKSYKVAPTRPFEGALKLNDKLNDVELWHKGDIVGPEAFVDYRGELYTSLHGGDIVKLVGSHITPIVKFGTPCKGVYEEKICGRPLGLALDKNGVLYAADAYYGLYKVDISSGKKERLVATGDKINGINVTLPNSVTVASNGDIFWTDSSTEFELQDGVFDLLADGSGRLIHYDPKTKKNTVLISDLHFANGVALSDDESFVLVSETARNRIHRYHLKGPKRGGSDIFIDGLPGFTDNLKTDGKGGFIVPLVVSTDDEHPAPIHFITEYPLVRKFVSRIFGIVQWTFKFSNELYPNEYSQKAVHFIGHFTMGSFTYPKRVSILHISKDGKILDSIHCLTGKLQGISEAHIVKDTLYLGSPFNDYIGRIPLSKVGWEHLKPAATPKPTTTTTPKPTAATPKPATATPKPTTTTPKPATTQPPTTAKAQEAQKKPVKDQPKAVPVKEAPKKN